MPSVPYPHLHPEVRRIAEMSEGVRRRHLWRHKYIPSAGQSEAIKLLEGCYERFPADRADNVAVIADTNLGKTTIKREMSRRHPSSNRASREFAHVPILIVQVAWSPRDSSLYDQILMTLNLRYGVPFNEQSKFQKKQLDTLYWLTNMRVRQIYWNDAQLFGEKKSLQVPFMQGLIMLSEEQGLSHGLFGLPETANILNSQALTANRFRVILLEPWPRSDDPDFLNFLDVYPALLPLRRRSFLTRPEIADYIFAQAEGIRGEVCTLLRRAGELGIGRSERIGLKELQLVDFVPPSGRMARARPSRSDGDDRTYV
jgi:hypothetical protein